MKFIPAEDGQVLHRLELTRRNLEVLLAKLDDPLSKRELVDPDWNIVVAGVEGPNGTFSVATDKGFYVPGPGQAIEVVPVENEVHYSDREPGKMYMPSSGETI